MNTESAALLAHLEELNAKTMAWVAEDPKGRWATTWTTDLECWAEDGVHPVEDFTKYQLVAYIFETTREIYGYKTSWAGLMNCSLDDLRQSADALSVTAKEHYEAEKTMAEERRADEEYYSEVMAHEQWTMQELEDRFYDAAERAGYY